MRLDDKIRKILVQLNKAYGKPRPLRKSEPIDELIRTVLSQNTNDRNSLTAFAVLKKNFKSWDKLLKTDTGKIARLIKHAGLANIKARRIKDILKEINRREGKIGLAQLKDLSTENAQTYLKSLKGVGPKTAACVLLFSFGKPVMPVDTHIFRVVKRLGLIDSNLNIEAAHMALTDMMSSGLTLRRGCLRQPCSGSSAKRKLRHLIYDFHLGIIEHGRKTCHARNPACGVCVLCSLCRFKRKAQGAKRKIKT